MMDYSDNKNESGVLKKLRIYFSKNICTFVSYFITDALNI